MYDRRVAGRTLRFGHAGILVDDAFVFYDHETDTYWLQATGEAFNGALQGHRLRIVPATVATWARWKAQHPQTTVLPGRRLSAFLGGYEGRARPQALGLAVVMGRRAKLYPFALLAETPLVQDVFLGTPLLVAYAPERGTAAAWGRRVAGRVLDLAPAETVHGGRSPGAGRRWRDAQTGSLWDARTGRAIAGPLAGEALALLTHHPIRTERFAAFYPNAPVYGESNR